MRILVFVCLFWICCDVEGESTRDIISEIEVDVEELFDYMIDPMANKVIIHFEPKKILPDETVDIEEIIYDSLKLKCSIPKQKEQLRTHYPPPEENRPADPAVNFDRSKKYSPLTKDEMKAMSRHFSVLQGRCHLDLATTIGKNYLYQFCYNVALKRGDVKTISTNTNIGTKDLTWENINKISEPEQDDIDWWGVVENDEVALTLTGYSVYLYQWFGDNVLIKYYCTEKAKYIYADERSTGKFIIAFGTPLVCSHSLFQRSKNHAKHIHCYIDPKTDEEQRITVDGVWKIFQAGEQKNQYSGVIEATKFQYFEWPKVENEISDRCNDFVVAEPVLYHLSWELNSSESYKGLGLSTGNHLCAGWTVEDLANSPGISVFRLREDGGIDGYWWHVNGFGIEEMTKVSGSHSLQPFTGEFAFIRTVTGNTDEESISNFGTVYINYKPSLDSYSLTWHIENAGYNFGKGILSENYLCVTWRETSKTNDGTVAYAIEGDRAYGRWTLAGAHKVQNEDLMRSSD